jgi:hypothetical protein
VHSPDDIKIEDAYFSYLAVVYNFYKFMQFWYDEMYSGTLLLTSHYSTFYCCITCNWRSHQPFIFDFFSGAASRERRKENTPFGAVWIQWWEYFNITCLLQVLKRTRYTISCTRMLFFATLQYTIITVYCILHYFLHRFCVCPEVLSLMYSSISLYVI